MTTRIIRHLRIRLEIADRIGIVIPMDRHKVDRAVRAVAEKVLEIRQTAGWAGGGDGRSTEEYLACKRLEVFLVCGHGLIDCHARRPVIAQIWLVEGEDCVCAVRDCGANVVGPDGSYSRIVVEKHRDEGQSRIETAVRRRIIVISPRYSRVLSGQGIELCQIVIVVGKATLAGILNECRNSEWRGAAGAGAGNRGRTCQLGRARRHAGGVT